MADNKIYAKGNADKVSIANKISNDHALMHELFAVVDHSSYYNLPDFGVFSLSLTEAAQLAAIDMWFSGVYDDREEPDGFTGDYFDPALKSLLSAEIEEIKNKLISSAGKGNIDTQHVQMDFDDNLLPDETFIHISALNDWLEKRGHESGDAIHEWEQDRGNIAELAIEELLFLKDNPTAHKEILMTSYRMFFFEDVNPDDVSTLAKAKAIIKDLSAQNKALLNNRFEAHRNEPAKPLARRPRNTLLTIINALCEYSNIDIKSRGAAAQIAKLTQELGADISEETILKYLKEIPDAVETRMK